MLGIGLIVAAINPSGSIAWVRAGILYGLVVLIFEIISALHGKGFHLGPVIFGLAFTLLLIAAYPERQKLIPEGAMRGKRTTETTPPAEDVTAAAEEAHPEPES